MNEEELAMVDELLQREAYDEEIALSQTVNEAPKEPENVYAKKPLSIKFGGEGRQKFTEGLISRIRRGVEDRRDGGFDDLIREFRRQYKGELEEKSEPYEGCSNFNVPLSQPIADTLHANYFSTFFSSTKWFVGDGATKAQLDDAQVKEDALQYILEKIIGFKGIADELIHRSIIDKSTVAHVYWEKSYSKKRVLELMPDGSTAEKTALVLDYNGVRVRPISILDFGFYPADAVEKKARIVEFHRVWLSRDDLMRGVTAGMYDEAAVKAVLASPSQQNKGDEEFGGNEDEIQAQGINTDSTVSDKDKPYQAFEGIYQFDDDGDGMDEKILFTIINQGPGAGSDYDSGTATLIRGTLYPYMHGDSWYVDMSPFLDPDSPYPPSLMERLADPQAETNAIQNMRTDRAIQENNAAFVAHSSLKRSMDKKKVAPGTVWFSDNPKEAILPISLQTGNQRGLDEVTFVRSLAEDIAGVNQTVMGRATGEATAREVERSVQGVNVKFDVQLERLARPFSKIAMLVAALYAQYMPEEMKYAIKEEGNAWDFATITQEQMKTEMGFTLQATSSMANPEFRAYIGEKMQMLTQTSPLITSDMELIWENLAYYYENVGGIRNFEKYIGTKQRAKLLQEQINASQGQPEKKTTVTERRDEVLSLAIAIESGEITPAAYAFAGKLAAEVNSQLPKKPEGADEEDATDNAAGYEKGDSQ